MQPPLSMRIYSAIMHKLPIMSGLTRLSFNRLINHAFRNTTKPIWASFKDGTPIKVFANDYHGRILYLFGTNDPKVTHTALALIKEGDVFLDIGANYSSIGLAAARAVGLQGKVHLFEPQQTLCNSVQLAIKSGAFQNVVLHQIGLWDEDTELTLTQPDHHSGMATFVSREQSEGWNKTETCTLREVAAYLIPIVEDKNFGVKLDIEGAEPKIMPWLLAQDRLRFLIFEAAHNLKELYDMVEQSGLTLFGLCRHPFRMRIKRLAQFEDMANYHDLVAVRIPKRTVVASKTSPYTLGKALSQPIT